MQTNNDILRDIAHELQTPISSMKGFLELVQHIGPLTERQKYFSDRALDVLLHMELMVARLSQLAWMDADLPLEPHSVDLRDVIDRAVTLLENQASQREITIEVSYAPRLGKIQGEERRLDQVMINLLSNAVKYNRDNGAIYVSVQGNKQEIQVMVRDTGEGILPEDQQHIFERYYRTRESRRHRIEGQGLGLAIVKGVIEKHGGRIWVESIPGEGCAFIFTLPRRFQKDDDVTREVAHSAVEPEHPLPHHAEGSDYLIPPTTGEETDAVDDNLQEPPEFNMSDAQRDDRSAPLA